MFSGLTNQVSSWMGGTGKKEGDPSKSEDEKLSSPITEIDTGNNTEGEKKDASPTKGSKLEMLSSVKSQMTGWLSGVPGLRKGDDTTAENQDMPAAGEGKIDVESPASEKSVKGSPVEQQKEDDDSRWGSATGGADSDVAASEPGTPAEDKEGGQAFGGAVSTKALQGAKSIGSFLFSAVNKAGKTVSEASAKIKKTVEENSLLGEFNKEQEAFIKEKQGKTSDAAVPPWVGCPNEESLKEEFLTLSTDRRNFVRSPPAGVDFQFDYEVSYPVAMATLAEDPNLEKMRFELVPKVINEETFWRNYFYRVSLIRQANELSSMAQEGGRESDPTSRANSTDVEPAEEEWEKELEAELQDYEVVADGNTNQDSNWESQIQEMLDAEETDLK
ncbi:synapse-associated protein of 47 kDa isoform X5 [Periplaneta americana]|uniref:synapse-associated protein of 47 kDa isoform X5 n=1 Tax=Periplaneta americana TaxID=6978 RepID=UPI0037E8B04B